MKKAGKGSPPFSLLIKPAGADCNLSCAYCFYLEKSSLYPASPRHRMSNTVLERLISSYMATKQPVYAFGWQGGEPTLMGLDFFRHVIRLQKEYGPPGARVSNGLQTNGTLMTDEMAAFFTEYRFLLGVSLDGPAEIHNQFRTRLDGMGSHREVMRGIRMLRRQRTEFNVLTLVTQANVRRGKEVYRYLKEEGFFYHQYIPCVEYDQKGEPLPWSIRGEEWGQFLLDIFDTWYPNDTRAISVRHFDAVIEALVSGTATLCSMGPSCSSYFVVEHNGDIYPCDFFVEPSLKLGNILEMWDWEHIITSPRYRGFGTQKSQTHLACLDCPYLNLCYGDCLKHRIGNTGVGKNSWNQGEILSKGRSSKDSALGLSVLCEGWKFFYEKTIPIFQELAQPLRYFKPT
ncbi:MAG: anaerobic sulfatase maturase [Spirochaetes bacterium]|nr:anaerobic sulfatase maturase [Spirochaetota bacterium]